MSTSVNRPVPAEKPPPIDPLLDTLGGGNMRREVAGCPTGLGDTAQQIAAQQGGGGGAPGTGAVNPSVVPSPGEGVTEEQVEQSGLDEVAGK